MTQARALAIFKSHLGPRRTIPRSELLALREQEGSRQDGHTVYFSPCTVCGGTDHSSWWSRPEGKVVHCWERDQMQVVIDDTDILRTIAREEADYMERVRYWRRCLPATLTASEAAHFRTGCGVPVELLEDRLPEEELPRFAELLDAHRAKSGTRTTTIWGNHA